LDAAENDGLIAKVQYICSLCKAVVKRSQFLLKLDADGSVADDWQGGLQGTCQPCSGSDFSKQEAERRMNLRTDVKARDYKRLRNSTYNSLLQSAGAEANATGKSMTWARTQVRDALKALCEEISDSFTALYPREFEDIMRRYWQIKKAEVSATSHSGPRPEGSADDTEAYVTRLDALTKIKGDKVCSLQLLSDICEGISRYFVCRNEDCKRAEDGSTLAFCSLNVFWYSTAYDSEGKPLEHGGWQWACPNCGRVYNPKAGGVPYHMAFYIRSKQSFILSAWPATAEESFIKALQEKTAGIDSSWDSMSMQEIMTRLTDTAEGFAVPAEMTDFSVPDAGKAAIEWINERRREGAGKKQDKIFHGAHIPARFPATFIPYKPGRTPIMSVEDTKRMVAGSWKHQEMKKAGAA
jgi:predicted RNA-binding Zn-ribbon protein involved in translation (DUF1610 family)